MVLVHQNHDIFAANHLPSSDFLTGTAGSVQPHQGVIDMDPGQLGPASTHVELTVSHRHLLQLLAMTPPSNDMSLNIERRMDLENVGAVQRKHAQVTAMFQIAQKYAPSLERNVSSTVEVEVWTMGGVVLLGLVISILN